MKTKEIRGITLIALVVTIVILLILAGVSYNLVLGEQGIIQKTKEAKEETEEAMGKETQDFERLDEEINSVTYKRTEEGVIIPSGFYYVGGTIDSGIVISDNSADENKYADKENVNIDLKGNQFVWVPVKNAVYSEEIIINNGEEKQNAINQVIEKINTDSNRCGYPMSIKLNINGQIEYVGVLYDCQSQKENDEYSVNFTALKYSQVNGDFREPDIASTADSFEKYLNILSYSNLADLEKDIHIYYNEMVESVLKYGGFFIARYETCYADKNKEEDNNSEIVFKQGREVINSKNWYEFCKLHNEYGKSINSNIESNSIYGSQWDQLMIYLRDIKNSINNNPYIIDATGQGACTGEKLQSGASNDYEVKNIFDLAGNVFEYTLETRSATTHTKRSSCFRNASGLGETYASKRNYVIINNDSNTGSIYDGGRCSFYLK